MRLIVPLLTAVFLLATPHTASAEPVTHEFGDLTLKLDSKKWRVIADGLDRWMVEPIDQKDVPPKVVRRIKTFSIASCSELAKAELASRIYRGLKEKTVIVAGKSATKIVAQSGCRSLAPRGQSLCIPYRGYAYIVTQSFDRCGFPGFAFDDIELFDEFVSKIKLSKRLKRKP